MSKITLYQLPPSPNNIKVRIALGYKGLSYEKVNVNPMDRSTVVEVSGQPLTPVLSHDGRVIFDSGAILRYLDANFPQTPKLFSADYETMKDIESWELYTASNMVEPVRMVIGQFLSGQKEAEIFSRASKLLHDRTECIESQLKENKWLVGDKMTAADVICAPFAFLGMIPAQAAASSPVAQFFAEHLFLGEHREKTRDWAGRVMAYDK